MKATLRLLIPDKKGIYKRIDAAVNASGGKIKHSRLARQMRGMSEAEVDVVFESELILTAIVTSIGRIPGVALLGAPAVSPGPHLA